MANDDERGVRLQRCISSYAVYRRAHLHEKGTICLEVEKDGEVRLAPDPTCIHALKRIKPVSNTYSHPTQAEGESRHTNSAL